MGINIVNKNFLIIIVFICLALLGCFSRPCKTTLRIKNEDKNGSIILIDRNKNYLEYEINNNEIKDFDNDIMLNVNYVFIKNKLIEGVFALYEYDHFFPAIHNIEIIIGQNEFVLEKNGKKINYINNYQEHFTEYNNGIIDFDTVKKNNYPDIYEIIKNK